MAKALRPRPTTKSRGSAPVRRSLPPEVLAELRRVAKPGADQEAISRLGRAVELVERGDARGAAKEAAIAKSMAPRSAAVREVLGLALYRQDRYREALSEMQTYRRMSGRADQNHIIADCLRAIGRPGQAVPLAEEALRARIPIGSKMEAVIVAAAALADMKRFDQALAMLRRVRTRNDVGRPDVLRVWYVVGDILERAGRREEAVREFRKILRHDPTAFDVAERLAQLG